MFKKSFSKSIFPNFLLSLSFCPFFWLSGANEFYKFLIFLISLLIIFFIFSIYNAVGQQVDQKCAATFSKKVLIQAKLAILDLKIMCPHSNREKGQLIRSCQFDPFNNNKIYFLFCNTIKPRVLFIYSHYLPLIIFFQKMKNAKNKPIRKHKLAYIQLEYDYLLYCY